MLLPVWCRQSLNVQFIYASTRGLRDVYDWLINLRQQKSYELQFTGQIIYLEHVLNDQFDPIYRQIYIEDAADVEYLYIYNQIEAEQQTYLYNNTEPFNGIYLDTNQEQQSSNQFIVNIPNTGINQDQLKKWINKYKLAGKNYTINII